MDMASAHALEDVRDELSGCALVLFGQGVLDGKSNAIRDDDEVDTAQRRNEFGSSLDGEDGLSGFTEHHDEARAGPFQGFEPGSGRGKQGVEESRDNLRVTQLLEPLDGLRAAADFLA